MATKKVSSEEDGRFRENDGSEKAIANQDFRPAAKAPVNEDDQDGADPLHGRADAESHRSRSQPFFNLLIESGHNPDPQATASSRCLAWASW